MGRIAGYSYGAAAPIRRSPSHQTKVSIVVPEIEILDADGGLRWDAPGILEALVYFPDHPGRRARYEARWRTEHRALLPSDKRLSRAKTYNLAKTIGGKNREGDRALLRKRREAIERVGTALWLQAVLSKIDPADATESRVSYALGEIGQGERMRTSRSTIKRDWRTNRGVVHWCAAIAYQRKIFGTPFPCYPVIGPPDYGTYEALWDFLRLGHEFYAFARDSGCFVATASFDPDPWTLPPGVGAIAPRRKPHWPDCDRIRAIAPDDAVLAVIARYDSSAYRW
jgi:hypothetical protein